MKTVIISASTIVILIVIWSFYTNYTHDHLLALTDTIEKSIVVSLAEDDWERAEAEFKELAKEWHKGKNVYSFFVDTNTLNDADFAIARAEAYLKARDYPLALGELANIKEQLHFLHANELITLENLF